MISLSWLLVLGFFVLSLGAAVVTTVVVWVKRRRFPLYGLLVITILLLFGSFSFLLRLNTKYNAIFPRVQVENTNVADLHIRTSVYLPVIKDHSTLVDVFISRPRQSPPSSSNALQPTVGLTPVGTPKVPIIKAFGPGYDVSAVVQLNASDFDIAPQGQQEQSLDQPSSVIFDWIVTPKYPGQQILEVMVTGRWVLKRGGTPVERPLAKQYLSIDVKETPAAGETASPFFTFGQLDVSQLLVIFLGSALNIPWIIELVKKMRLSRQQEQKKTTQSSPIAASPSGRKKRGRKR